MRLLVLTIDRDDDLGRKTSLRGPIIGKSAMVEAGKALALADPEESDANAIFGAVHEYDRVLRERDEHGVTAAETALVTGHLRVGTKSDVLIAKQFDQVLQKFPADQVLLVSDGAEDEYVLPILASRVKVAGVHRVVVKQSQSVEGFLYLLQRLMQDEKMQRRFFLPLAFLLFAAAFSVFFARPGLFISAALALAGFYILVQVFGWADPLEDFFSAIADEIRAGKLALLAATVSLVLVAAGGWLTWRDPSVNAVEGTVPYLVEFATQAYWWVAAAMLVVLGGRALDNRVRHGQIGGRTWKSIFFFLGLAIFLWAGLIVARTYLDDASFLTVPVVVVLTYVFFAGFFLFAGMIAKEYYRAGQLVPPSAP